MGRCSWEVSWNINFMIFSLQFKIIITPSIWWNTPQRSTIRIGNKNTFSSCRIFIIIWLHPVFKHSQDTLNWLSRSVILNRGPHGPPGGNLQVLGRNTEHLGNWGGMDPFGGNQQIAINRPGCSSSWRIVAASPVFVDVTLRPEGSSALPQDTVPRPKWTLGLWRTTFLAPRHSYFWQKWKCMHYQHNEFQNFLQNWALDAHDALHRKSTLAFIRHCSRVGGGGMTN